MSSIAVRSRKSVVWALVAGLVLTAGIAAKPVQVQAASDEQKKVSTAMKKAVNYYYKRDRSYKFDGFDWELVSLKEAGEKLTNRKWQTKQNQSAIDAIVPAALKAKGAGEIAKYAIALMKNGYDPTNVNGVNLLQEIADLQEKSGKMGDDTYTIANHVYSMIALEMYDFKYDRDAAVAFLLDHYDDYENDKNKSKFDELGFALSALPLVDDEAGVKQAEKEIITELKAGQDKKDGSYYDGFAGGSPDTTSQVLIGLSAAGEDVLEGQWVKSVDYLLTKQVKNGGFEASWTPGEANPYTTKFALLALATANNGDSAYQRLSDQDKEALKAYVTTIDLSGQVEVYAGLENLQKGTQTKPSGNAFTVNAGQVLIRTNVADVAKEGKPVAVLVQVQKDKKVVQLVTVEADGAAKQLTAGFSLDKGTYTVQLNYWYGLSTKPETAKDPVTFQLVVK
ncbi:hypothetical protein EDM56_30280 [Brevibacillus fluminis]|uniref:Uncharacterized protein n=1 Tax=Brevibacillus fluminis TaxID=511487 RepID=A0A3M8CSV2_9BACL|nr:hypothetical protein [Brevibacillus fluminis]RNB78763.1 hypothetical protein EDM56_30280 [Brevibacillus fluminis]